MTSVIQFRKKTVITLPHKQIIQAITTDWLLKARNKLIINQTHFPPVSIPYGLKTVYVCFIISINNNNLVPDFIQFSFPVWMIWISVFLSFICSLVYFQIQFFRFSSILGPFFSAYATFSEKLSFLTPWYARVVRDVSFSENFTYVLNELSLL